MIPLKGCLDKGEDLNLEGLFLGSHSHIHPPLPLLRTPGQAKDSPAQDSNLVVVARYRFLRRSYEKGPSGPELSKKKPQFPGYRFWPQWGPGGSGDWGDAALRAGSAVLKDWPALAMHPKHPESKSRSIFNP